MNEGKNIYINIIMYLYKDNILIGCSKQTECVIRTFKGELNYSTTSNDNKPVYQLFVQVIVTIIYAYTIYKCTVL